MNAVEFDFEGGEAGAFAFARFEVEQEFVAVVLLPFLRSPLKLLRMLCSAR